MPTVRKHSEEWHPRSFFDGETWLLDDEFLEGFIRVVFPDGENYLDYKDGVLIDCGKLTFTVQPNEFNEFRELSKEEYERIIKNQEENYKRLRLISAKKGLGWFPEEKKQRKTALEKRKRKSKLKD